MRFDGIIFDVDGTIWDSTSVVEKAWNAAIESVGVYDVKVTANRLKGLFGLPMEDIILDIMPNEPKEKRDAFRKICSRYEFEYIEKQTGVLYENMEEVLDKLHDMCQLYIVSNCQAGYIDLLYRKTGFNKYFKDQLCPGDTGLLKAENIKKIIEKYNIKNPVYVGDTQMDANACAAVNVPIIFAAYGFGNIANPYATIYKPSEIFSVI